MTAGWPLVSAADLLIDALTTGELGTLIAFFLVITFAIKLLRRR